MNAVKLRGYQNDSITGTRESFLKGSRRVACVLPTGSGKTTIFGQMCRTYADKSNGKRAVIISHLGLLTSQTGDRFREEWGLASEVLQADRLPSTKAQTIITTMQSFRSEKKLLKWANKLSFRDATLESLNVGLIIIDECHLAGNDSYQDIMAMFPNAYVIGFTATPFRQNKLMTNLFDEVAYTISTQELIDQGFLVPPKLCEMDYDSTDQADMFAKIVNMYKAHHEGQKAVVYLKTIDEANLLRNVLVDAGITSSAVTSKLTGKLRDDLLKEFRKGRGPSVLTTVDVLTAGFDSPNLRAIFMPYKVGSVTTYLQRVGRGLRIDEGKTHCDVYVNSNAPSIEAGFWEKINKQMLMAGKKSHDNFADELEYNKDSMGTEEYIWTKSVVQMAKEVRLKNMGRLADMIIHKDFPAEMLQAFISNPPLKARGRTKPTIKQADFVRSMGVDTTGLSKQECSAIIDSKRRASGWKPPQDEVVQCGKHKGKHYAQVPPLYWRYLATKGMGTEVYQGYIKYKNKVGKK